MALGLLLILFMVMSIISVVGLLLLFLLKGERAQKIVFYFMALLGMFIAWMTATGYATNQIKEQMISWGFGALAVVAVLVRLCGKSKMQHWRQSCWRRHLWCSAWWHYLLAKKD